ncbi:MAG: hypothetical protein LBS40_04480 [Burkholderiales bacterium]|nr:hypothetical protein [Burkholderiales bacterium]
MIIFRTYYDFVILSAWIRRLLFLLLLFFVLHTPLAHTYPSHRITLPNGEYIEADTTTASKIHRKTAFMPENSLASIGS